MIKGKLENGFEYEYDERVLTDMRFVDLIAEVDDNPLVFPKLATMLLGKEQKERLYKHLEKDGYVSAENFSDAIAEIFKASNLKN